MSRAEALRRRAADERGVFMILWSLLLVGLITMVAIVVDLGHLRETRATAQTRADLAALAAGVKMASLHGPEPVEACQDAMEYLRRNTRDLPAGTSVPCNDLPASCAVTDAPVAVTDGGTAAPYAIAITYPVSDEMIRDDRAQGGLRPDDGTQCERFGVSMERTNDGFFSGIVDVDSLSVSAGAVVRRQPPETNRIPNLWLLDPTGCNALTVQGGSVLTVGTASRAGLITLDSDGSECQNDQNFTIDAGGSGTRIRVIPPNTEPPGEITLVAMRPGQQTCADGNPRACQQSDVDNGSISPQPTRRSTRATRAIVDHRYNCRVGQPSPQYPDYPEQISGVPRIEIRDCTDPDGKPYIDQLRSAVGVSGQPTGFQRWRAQYGCNNPAVPPALEGNWWIDCPSGLKITNVHVNFTGGNIVFDSGLEMSGGSIRFNSGDPAPASPPSLSFACQTSITGCLQEWSPQAAWVYFRPGASIDMTGGTLNVKHAAVIQNRDPRSDAGYIRLAGGVPPVWSSPQEGPFEALSLWSEAHSSRYRINGGASMDLEGVFFTPEANAFSLSGGSPVTPQDAQFITYHLEISGGANLTLEPDGVHHLLLPPPVASLIR